VCDEAFIAGVVYHQLTLEQPSYDGTAFKEICGAMKTMISNIHGNPAAFSGDKSIGSSPVPSPRKRSYHPGFKAQRKRAEGDAVVGGTVVSDTGAVTSPANDGR
jgi:hypothetical protein